MECFSFRLNELKLIILRNIIEIKHLELEYVVVIQISKFQSRAQLDSFLNLYQKGLLFILMLTAMAINVIAYEIRNLEACVRLYESYAIPDPETSCKNCVAAICIFGMVKPSYFIR